MRRPSFRKARRGKLLAVTHFRDEERYLPGMLENVAPHVDGIVAADDGSTDRSREIVAGHPKVIDIVDTRRDYDGWFREGEVKRALLGAAVKHDAEWLLGVDADERLEQGFRERADRVMRDAPDDTPAFYLRWLECWGSPDRFRSDGLWGQKRKAVLFRSRRDHLVDHRPLHTLWVPMNEIGPLDPGRTALGYPHADLIVYHLRMIEAGDRRQRRERYEQLDPERRWQTVGYGYLTDTRGMRLEPLPAGREYEPLPAAT